MKTILEYINKETYPFTLEFDNLDERQIFQGKCVINTTDHADKRQKERDVTDEDVYHAVLGGWDEIKKLYEENKLKVGKRIKTKFLICDTRESKEDCICVVGALVYNKYEYQIEHKLKHPTIAILTVFKGQDFAGLKRKDGYNHNDHDSQYKIFVY